MEQITQALQQLHQELERLAPAVDHVEAAFNVMVAVEQVVGSNDRLSKVLTADFQRRKEAIVVALDSYLENLKKETGEIGRANENLIQGLGQKHEEELRQIMDHLQAQSKEVQDKADFILLQNKELGEKFRESHQAELRDVSNTLSEHSNALKTALDLFLEDAVGFHKNLAVTTQSIYDDLAEKDTELRQTILSEHENLIQLRKQMDQFFREINMIDFPSRLGKIDVAISSVLSEVQSAQGKIEQLEHSFIEQAKQHGKEIEKLKGEVGLNKTLLIVILIVLATVLGINIFSLF